MSLKPFLGHLTDFLCVKYIRGIVMIYNFLFYVNMSIKSVLGIRQKSIIFIKNSYFFNFWTPFFSKSPQRIFLIFFYRCFIFGCVWKLAQTPQRGQEIFDYYFKAMCAMSSHGLMSPLICFGGQKKTKLQKITNTKRILEFSNIGNKWVSFAKKNILKPMNINI